MSLGFDTGPRRSREITELDGLGRIEDSKFRDIRAAGLSRDAHPLSER